MTTKEKQETVLSIFPNRYGFAYAVFESPEKLLDCGTIYVQPATNRRVMQRVREYVDYYKPTLVICRNTNDQPKRNNKRISRLINLICQEATSQGLQIRSYTRSQIKEVFEQFGAKSKFEISRKIIEWFPQLKMYEYPPRLEWQSEHPDAGVFDSISLAVCYWYLG